ncbi:MAG: hypothetical protein R2751_19060 [Bacteroidales bacterium]
MRRLIIVFLFVFPMLVCNAQEGILWTYNDTHIGKSIALSYNKSLDKYQIELGVKYQYINPYYDTQNFLFKDRIYPTSFLQHFGPVLGISRKFRLESEVFIPEVFFQSQYVYSSLKNSGYTFYGVAPAPDNRDLYTYYHEIFKAEHNIENILGFGFRVLLGSRLSYSTRIGAIECMFIDLDDRISLSARKVVFELGFFYSVGIFYTFSDKSVRI